MFSLDHDGGGKPLRQGVRVLLVAWSLLLVGVFALASRLEPDPRRLGTHEQLGFPPCTFLTLSGLPCPSCGMTTSFACLVRGRFLDASRANGAGVLLATVLMLQVPWCWWSAYRGRYWRVTRPLDVAVRLLIAIGVLCMIRWLWQILLLTRA